LVCFFLLQYDYTLTDTSHLHY